MTDCDSTSAYRTDAEATVLLGHVACGKTERLIFHAAELLEQGTDPKEIIIFAATPTACECVRKRLADRCGAEIDLPVISTAMEYELSLLETPDAMRKTGRQPRVLLGFERSILLADMAVSGVHAKRLSEMIRFFCRSLSDLERMEDDWFYNQEEEHVFALLQETLDYYAGFLAPEIGRAAYDYQLQAANEGTLVKHFAHVLVDDYQLLGKASQALTGAIAEKTLWIAGDTLSTTPVLEEYPYVEGLSTFIEANPSCKVLSFDDCHASSAVAKSLNTLLGDAVLGEDRAMMIPGEPEGSFQIKGFGDPKDEFTGICDMVSAQLESGLSPDDIAVACPNRVWIDAFVKEFASRNIPLSTVPETSVDGDVRDPSKSSLASVVLLLMMAANPRDQLALRCWCARNDHLANSSFFRNLIETDDSIDLLGQSAPAQAEENKLIQLEAGRVRRSLQQAGESVLQLHGLSGRDLFDAACNLSGLTDAEQLPEAIRDVISSLPCDASAAVISRIIRTRCLFPTFQGNGVKVALHRSFTGTSIPFMVMPGMVDGFIPARQYFDPTIVERDKRPQLLARDMERVYSCMGKVRDSLTLSYFENAPLADAERLRLKIYRVRLHNGERICEVHPSETIRTLTGRCFHD